MADSKRPKPTPKTVQMLCRTVDRCARCYRRGRHDCLNPTGRLTG